MLDLRLIRHIPSVSFHLLFCAARSRCEAVGSVVEESALPIFFVDEGAEAAHVAFCRPFEVPGQPAFPEQVGPPVAHPLHKGNLLWQPRVQRGGPDFGAIGAQGAMHPTAVEADEDAQVHRSPSGSPCQAISTPGKQPYYSHTLRGSTSIVPFVYERDHTAAAIYIGLGLLQQLAHSLALSGLHSGIIR